VSFAVPGRPRTRDLHEFLAGWPSSNPERTNQTPAREAERERATGLLRCIARNEPGQQGSITTSSITTRPTRKQCPLLWNCSYFVFLSREPKLSCRRKIISFEGRSCFCVLLLFAAGALRAQEEAAPLALRIQAAMRVEAFPTTGSIRSVPIRRTLTFVTFHLAATIGEQPVRESDRRQAGHLRGNKSRMALSSQSTQSVSSVSTRPRKQRRSDRIRAIWC